VPSSPSSKSLTTSSTATSRTSLDLTRDEGFMRVALDLARPMLGLTTPNPAVGCVIVSNNRIVGRGATAAGGRPHGETVALAQAAERARGATAYVSLEPCAHQGQTPPCARALVYAGIARVVVGCRDPYPPVRGRGIAILRVAGVEVAEGVLEEECRRLNEGFFIRVTRGRPFVTLKLAASLDGRIAAVGGDSRWISSPESRELVHRWRREADAVMVGAATVLADNPRLTCRTAGGRDPARVIIDGRLRSPASAKVFRQRSSAPTILVTTPTNRPRAERLYGNRRGARSIVEIVAAQSKAGKIDLNALMREFGRRGWSKILLEGGAHLAGAALAAGIVDRVAFFIAPRILGGGLPAVEGMISRSVRGSIRLGKLHVAPVGDDLLIEAEIAHPPSRKRRKSPV
jgi:diaminohydroxyphosphoribosylaminopyrimidine deaminase/5-amino-6-(5-phosphoribosylamino)uracil reductase